MNPSVSDPCFLGVLGGMGPMAAAAFTLRLAELTPSACDQHHIPTLLRNDPRIPDRSRAGVDGGEDPLPHMLAGMRFLQEAGVALIAIPCNTAHLWYDALSASTRVPVLHIVDSVIADLRRIGVDGGVIGLMGTPATLKLGLYQQRLEAAGYSCLLPTDEDMRETCLPAIAAVKGNRLAQAPAYATAGVARLKARGARTVVLGCTELPLALPQGQRAALGVPVTDSIDALARAVIERFRHAPSCMGEAQ